MHDPLQRLYRTKLVLLATLLLSVGVAFLVVGHYVQRGAGVPWLRSWPIVDIGSGLFTTGLLGVALQYFDGQDSEERATGRLERVIANATPAMRDAVIDGFAFDPDDLARVATPEVLDQIVTNGLGIRLGDQRFAGDILRDLQIQAIQPPERLYDARVRIDLSTDRESVKGRAPMFVVTCRWEFEVVPKYPVRRFLCTSDESEFRDLDQDTSATSAWMLRDRPGVDASKREDYELLEFTIEGEQRSIRRSQKADGQTYTVAIGSELIEKAEPVTMAYTFRTVVPIEGHFLQLRVDQPTKGLTVELDYDDTDLETVRALDFIASSEASRIAKPPKGVDGRSVSIECEGWLMGRSGVVFVW